MNVKFAFAILTASLLAAGCATTQDTAQPSTTPAEASTMLTGEEIRSLISGNTVEGKVSDGYYFKGYHAPDGTVSATSEGGGKTYRGTGTWQIKSDTVCVNWANKDWKSGCGTYAKNGESHQFKSTTFGGPSIPAAKVVEGNPHNL